LAFGALSETKITTLLTFGAAVVWIASTRQMRLVSYPQSVFRKALTVSTVGELAVKNFGSTGGNGSALVSCPRLCNFSGAAGFCASAAAGVVAAVPAPVWDTVCAPAIAVTLRAVANPANIKYELFKEPFLLPPLSARSISANRKTITPEP